MDDDAAPFRTARLGLRLLDGRDEALYLRLYGDPGVMAHIGPAQSPDVARRGFAAACRLNQAAAARERRWVAARHADGEPVGLVALLRDASSAAAELGVMLVPEAQGEGLALELCDAMLAHAFAPADGQPLERVWARHAPGHAAAARVLAAAGLVRGAPEAGADTWTIERARWLATRRGSLACVGVGMMLGAHFAPRARSHVEQADVVLALVSDPVVELWLQRIRPDLRSLQPFYGDGTPGGKSRRESYAQMVEALLADARAGRSVCGVFYGHPGVFAEVPHRAIARARAEGIRAHMEPAISAEDCLYADLGIDPGAVGCQHYEASQFMFYRRRIDPSAWLVLWQVGVAGDRSLALRSTGPAHRAMLVELLAETYPPDHEVVAYEAATLPVADARVERFPLRGLVDARMTLHTTLAIPPAVPMRRNEAVLRRLAELEAGGSTGEQGA